LQAVILAGGLGTRQRPTTDRIPKAMIPVAGRPFIDYQLELLRRNGVHDIVLCVGHLGELLEDHLKSGAAFGLDIRYSWDGPKLLGPAGALKRAERLVEERFFVTYGDAYLRAPYRKLMAALANSGRLGMMSVFRNEGRFGASDISVRGGLVVRYDKQDRTGRLKWINFGLSALTKEALETIPAGHPCGEEEFYGELIKGRQLAAYEVHQRFYEIGTPASLADFAAFVARGGNVTLHRTRLFPRTSRSR